jgi:peroxiredoxin Q/BCP
MTEICIGTKAPEFTLPASNGTTISLMDFRGDKYVVLYFYPEDSTPGCTQEAISFRDLQSEFQLAGAAILGVSTDDLESHSKFAQQYNLTFSLLSDSDGAVTEKYGVRKPRATAGAHARAQRTTFVIDKQGKIARIFNHIKLQCHADEVLAFLHGKQESELAAVPEQAGIGNSDQ